MWYSFIFHKAYYNLKPINLTLQKSYRLWWLLIAAGWLFGGVCYYLPIPWPARAILMALIWLVTVYYGLRYALLKLPQSIVAIHVNNKNQLQLVRKNGQQLDAQVQANTVVTGSFTVLNCQLKAATFWQKVSPLHVIILPNAANAEDFRQLRVWLRWAKNILPQTAVLDSADENRA